MQRSRVPTPQRTPGRLGNVQGWEYPYPHASADPGRGPGPPAQCPHRRTAETVRPHRRAADPRLAAAGPARGRRVRLRLHRRLPHRPGPRRLPGNDLLPQPGLGEHQHPRFPHVRRGPHGRGLSRDLRRHPLPGGRGAPGPRPSRGRGPLRRHPLAGALRRPQSAPGRGRREGPRRGGPRAAHQPQVSPPPRPAASTSAWPGSRPWPPAPCGATTTG